MKNTLSFMALVVLTGCATGRNDFLPSASSQYPAESQMIAERTIQIRQGPFELAAAAEPMRDLIVVNLEFANNSKDSVRLERSKITMADGRGRILPPVVIDHRIRSLRSDAEKSNEKARALERDLEAREAEKKAGKSSKTIQTLDSVADILGNSPASYRNDAAAAEAKADAFANHRDSAHQFFSSEVAPGQKLGGIVYFEAPAQWPATLTVHAGTTILAADFTKPSKK